MTIKRIHSLSAMPEDKGLKPLPCPTFKEARRLARDKSVTIYYYRRKHTSKFPPLMFEEVNLPEPQPEAAEQPAASFVQLAMF